jgi:STE24 endopeptidase
MEVRVDVRDDRDAHRRRRTLAAALLAGAAVWTFAALILLRTKAPALNLQELDPAAYFSPAELDRIAAFRVVSRWLWIGSTALELLVLALLAWKARPLAAWIERWARGRVRTGVALGLAVSIAVWLATLAFAAAGHWWRRRYGLSDQGYAPWLADEALALLVTSVLVAVAVAGALYLAGRLGRRWWIAGAAALSALGVFVVLAQPLLIQPLFNRFTPLPDRSLAAEIAALGNRLGVAVTDVEVADASRRTTAANAQVTGIGPTRRVALYDTLLDGRFTRDEILAVSAHELAHVSRHHVWKGVAWFALLAIPALTLVAWVTERRGGLRDPAVVPLALLCAFVLFLVTLPVQNAVSRRYEAEADWLALTATRDPAAAIGLDRRLALSGLVDPDPPAWARVLLGTHPTTLERIAMAEAFRRRP